MNAGKFDFESENLRRVKDNIYTFLGVDPVKLMKSLVSP